MTLPPGCFHKDTNSNVVDVGYCAESRCLRNDTNFTVGACSDRRYCCGQRKTDNIPILCSGNISFQLSCVQECGCTDCNVKMAKVAGIVLGRHNELPMRYGDVIVEGLDDTVTDGEGMFNVEVPEGMSRVIITFRDIFQKLESTTKVFRVDAKQVSFFKIHLRERAPVIELNSTLSKTIPLGQADMQSFADVEITEDSFLSEDGTPFHGHVKARVAFIDPRNASDVLMSPGDFSALDDDGEEQLLMSYGMLSLNFEDSQGKRLDVVKPIKVVLDTEQINMTDIHGNTTAKLWWLDKKTGRWIKAGELYPTDRNTGKRRKRSPRRFFVGELSEAVSQDTVYNIDAPEIYSTVAVEAPVDTVVTMVGKQRGGNQFYGYRQETVTNQNTRRICMATYTGGEAFLLAEKDGEPLDPSDNQISSLPDDIEAVIVSSSNIDANRISVKAFRYIAKVSGSGPIYLPWQCPFEEGGNIFRFTDNYAAQQNFEMSTIRIDDRRNPQLWYGLKPFDSRAERCYIKVKVEGSRAVIMAKSFTVYNGINNDYGYSAAITGWVETRQDDQVSVVCLEYRCNGLLIDPSIGYNEPKQETLISVVPLTSTCTGSLNSFLAKYQTQKCHISVPAPTGQEIVFCVPREDTGNTVGIYSGDDGLVQSKCYKGSQRWDSEKIVKEAGGPTLTLKCQ